MKLGQVLTVGSVFEVMEMGLMVDAIASPVLFEEEDKYRFVHPSSGSEDLMDRLGKAIRLTARYAIAQWKNMDFDERIQADPSYIDRALCFLGIWLDRQQ